METTKNTWLQDTMDVFDDLLKDVRDDSADTDEHGAAEEELYGFVKKKLIESYKNGARAEWRKHHRPEAGGNEERVA